MVTSIFKLYTFFLFVMLFAGIQYKSSAQEYIYISRSGIRDMMRVNMAYTNWSITPADSSAKSANGIHLLNEVKLVSGLWNKDWAFTMHDAFYFDISLGAMSNTPRKVSATNGGMEDENKFSVTANFGYLLLAGYRNERWAALAGVDFRWNSASVGFYHTPELDGNLLNYTRPLVVRGEICVSKTIADKRIIAMFWSDNGSTSRSKYLSARLELPLGSGGRWWLFGQYIKQTSRGDDRFYANPGYTSILEQFNVGFRIQNALL